MKFSFKVILAGVIGIVIGVTVFLSPLSGEIEKIQNPCLFMFKEYANMFYGIQQDDKQQMAEIVNSDKAMALVAEFQAMGCHNSVEEWADQNLQDKILLSQMNMFGI